MVSDKFPKKTLTGVPMLYGHNTAKFGAFVPSAKGPADQSKLYAIVHQHNKMNNASSENGQSWAAEMHHQWRNNVLKKCGEAGICPRGSSRSDSRELMT